MNGWLMKSVLQEEEEKPNGAIRFSPSRIAAPAVFIVSNDWNNMPWEWSQRLFALKVNTGESEVMRAMHNFVPDCEQTIGEPG